MKKKISLNKDYFLSVGRMFELRKLGIDTFNASFVSTFKTETGEFVIPNEKSRISYIGDIVTINKINTFQRFYLKHNNDIDDEIMNNCVDIYSISDLFGIIPNKINTAKCTMFLHITKSGLSYRSSDSKYSSETFYFDNGVANALFKLLKFAITNSKNGKI